MTVPRILVAGLGNIFLGDDAFGVAVAQRLAARTLPAGVRVIDFGIRGIDLTFALMDGYDAIILVDAVSRGQPPGTLYVIEPEIGEGEPAAGASVPLVDMHDLDPAKVLRLAQSLGAKVHRVLLVGCEPQATHEAIGGGEALPIALSAPVSAAVEQAIQLVESLVSQLQRSAASFGPLLAL
jgi:hydrogenase maturation protease